MSEAPRIDEDLLRFFGQVPSSIVTDGLTRLAVGAWMDDIAPLRMDWRVAGRVRTLQCAPKSGGAPSGLSIYSFSEQLAPGDIIVIGAGGARGWLMGENMANFCINQGVGGIVTDGRVRDLAELLELPLPILSRGRSARPGSQDIAIVAADVPIACAGAYVRPGDLIVGDFDGVAVAPHRALDALRIEAEELMMLEKEQEIAIRERQPLSVVQAINARKKQRRSTGAVS